MKDATAARYPLRRLIARALLIDMSMPMVVMKKRIMVPSSTHVYHWLGFPAWMNPIMANPAVTTPPIAAMNKP
jgi:hypothetical protein